MTDNEKLHNSAPPSGRDRGDAQIFLCDATAEAGRLLNALQSKGYAIVDVPLGLLPNRTLYELPKVLICDADATETPRRLREMRDAVGDVITIILVGHPELAANLTPDLKEWAHEILSRPLDIEATVDRIARLVGSPQRRSHRPLLGGPHRAPSLVTAARKPYRSDGRRSSPYASRRPLLEASDSQWPVDSPPSRGPSPSDGPRLRLDGTTASRSLIPSSHPPSSNRVQLSPETQNLLDEGRRHLESYPQQPARPIRLPMVAQATGDVIRNDFLSALEEPLDDGDLESVPPAERELTSGGTRDLPLPPRLEIREQSPEHALMRATTRPRHNDNPAASDEADRYRDSEFEEEDRTNPGGKPATQPPPESVSFEGFPPESQRPSLTVPLPLDDLSDLLVPWSSPKSFRDDAYSISTPPQTRRQEPPSQPTAIPLSAPALSAPSLPAIYPSEPRHFAESENDLLPDSKSWVPAPALAGIALAIRERLSGAVAQQEAGGIRRVVLMDGDIATVSSSLEVESLAHFLHSRGDYNQKVLSSLGSIPGFGRHAGAALIARGLLQQEDLWPVLRAHAEWILGKAILSAEPTQMETTIPTRLAEEPTVFGGAAGTEIFLEAVRRVVSPEQAFLNLGAGKNVLGLGRYQNLLGESAITPQEQQAVLDIAGQALEPILIRQPELLPLLYAFCQLGVLTSGGDSSVQERAAVFERSIEIDDDAFISRVRTRSALVEEGDYFTILGITRSATGYEVDRAHRELLQEYAEQRLTPRTLHLRKELESLRGAIDEAHLVLQDDVRRKRYRDALEALPS